MKPQPLFPDHNNTLRVIFDKLLTYLQPVETSRKKESYYVANRYDNKKASYTVIFNSCNFSNIGSLPLSFDDIKLTVTEQMITISGTTFKYQFAPDQLLTIYNRLKKIIK
jgi:hypothetical protein